MSVGAANCLALADMDSTRAVTILGARSKYPCPVCLIPSDELWDLSGGTYPRRTRDGALQLISDASEAPTKKAAKEILATQSIRNVPVCYSHGNRMSLELTIPRTHF